MSGFLTELGTKIADRWMTLLVLPGLLWTAALAAALRLGQEHAVDVAPLRVWLDQIAGEPASHYIATVALAAAATLLAAVAVALAAFAFGALLPAPVGRARRPTTRCLDPPLPATPVASGHCGHENGHRPRSPPGYPP